MKVWTSRAAMALCATALSSGVALADEWWPFAIEAAVDGDADNTQLIEYVPLEGASQEWSLCVLFPHLQDSYWVSVNYGIAAEARRQGVRMNLLQAGGYANLPRQVSQYDDCLASGADAILIGAISEAGMAAKIEEGMEQGVVNIGVANPILETTITARIMADYYQKGLQSGNLAAEHLGDVQGMAVAFPGPQGSGWAETYLEGFRSAAAANDMEILGEYFGEASIPAQLRLVEDALQSHPDLNLIWGGAPTAEAAIGALIDAGRDDVLVMSSYENQTILTAIERGEILGLASEFPVMMGRIVVDLAVRALEGEEHETLLVVAPGVVTADNVDEFDTTQIFAPLNFQPVFSVP